MMIRLLTLLIISLFFASPIPLGGHSISSTEASSLLNSTAKQFSLVEQKRYTLVSSAPKYTSQPDTSGLPQITQVVIEMTCKDLKTSDVQKYWGCINNQLQESKESPSPDLSSLDQPMSDAIMKSCQFAVGLGIENFNGCINENFIALMGGHL